MLPQRGRDLEDSITGGSSLLCVCGPQVRSSVCHLFPSSLVAQYQVWWGGLGQGSWDLSGAPRMWLWVSKHTRPSCSYLIPLSSSRDLLLRFGTEFLLIAHLLFILHPSHGFPSRPSSCLLPPPQPILHPLLPTDLGLLWGVNKTGTVSWAGPTPPPTRIKAEYSQHLLVTAGAVGLVLGHPFDTIKVSVAEVPREPMVWPEPG